MTETKRTLALVCYEHWVQFLLMILQEDFSVLIGRGLKVIKPVKLQNMLEKTQKKPNSK